MSLCEVLFRSNLLDFAVLAPATPNATLEIQAHNIARIVGKFRRHRHHAQIHPGSDLEEAVGKDVEDAR